MAERRPDLLSLLVGLAAVVGAGLLLLDRSGAVRVDEAVTLAALWIVLGLVGLARSVVRLRRGGLRHSS